MMLDKMDSLQQTAEFMRAAGQHIPSAPAIPANDVAGLRLSLLHEELRELTQALAEGNMVEVLDALADLQVVLNGAVLACGMQDVFPAALNEVHRSNMSKFPQSLQELTATVDHYKAQGIDVVIVSGPEGRVVLRMSDNKVLKSIHYSPANLAPLLS